jgi:threonyl-tRNA synthetase
VQAIVLPIADRHLDYAHEVRDALRAAGLRGEVDERPESTGRKIRDAEVRKVPYMLIVGDRERDARTVGLREHGKGDAGAVDLDDFVARVRTETENRSA